VRQALHDPAFQARHRRDPRAFCRRRQLTFARVLLLLLQKGAQGLAGRLASFFGQLAAAGEAAQPVTVSAWCQARAKLLHTALIELNVQAVLGSFYGPANAAQVQRWGGYRLSAIDGSVGQLPTSAALGAHFGWVQPSNQSGPCGARQVQARLSVCYDVLNGLVLDGRLARADCAEHRVGALHLEALGPGDLVITDRGYCNLEWFWRVRQVGADFVCRVPRRWHARADELFARDEAGVSLPLELGANGRQRRAWAQAGLGVAPGARLRLRLVSVRLATGELEVLATSLRDRRAHPAPAFGEVYGWRWGVEGFYGGLKGWLELENFSGQSLEAVRQDFYAGLLVSNVAAVLSAPAQAALRAGDAGRRQPARVNRAQSFGAVKRQAWELFYSEAPAEEVLAQLTQLLLRTPVAQRRGRAAPRRRAPSASRSLRHARYKKKHAF